MRRMKGWASAGLAVLSLVSGSSLGSATYLIVGGPGAIHGQTSRDDDPAEIPGAEAAWNAKRLKALNQDRHKSMVSDTEKLLKLARQLDAEVASNPKGQLTPEEMRKVSEIERLARSVKTKMALSYAGGPQVRAPALPLGGPNGSRTP